MKKKLLCIFLAIVCVMTQSTAFAAKMYAPDGRTINVNDSDVKAWEAVGWYTTPVIRVYSPSGKEAVIYKKDLSAWRNVGWYDYPVVTMYSPYGKTIVVAKSSKESWKAVGWYSYPVMTVYAPDGRTTVIDKASLSAWKAVGWSEAPDAKEEDIVYVNGKPYYLGMSRSGLGTPDEKLASLDGFTWYVFGTETYDDFFAAGVKDGRVIALVSAGPAFEYGGYAAGDTLDGARDKFTPNLYTDSNAGGMVHTVYLCDYEYVTEKTYTKGAFAGESKLNFHLVNAFRRFHGESILKWSEKAEVSARLHSQDMADNNFFSHTNLEGKSSSVRMSEQGIDWRGCGENIAAGYSNAVYVHNGWVNSPGHRANMLRPYFEYLGVGMARGVNSGYGLYYTQNFYQ